MAELTQQELGERIAILKRFRLLLEQQRNKFREYLNVLEKQEHSIESEDSEALLAHTELEQQVVENISSIQKVIVPLRSLYTTAASGSEAGDTVVIAGLQNDLSDLQTKVLAQNARNRDLLKTHISQIRSKIRTFKNPYTAKRSVYAEKTAVGNLIEIEA